MQRIGGFRSGAAAEVARTALAAHGVQARVVVDEAFGLDPAGKWAACLEVADEDHEVAVMVLSADRRAVRVPAGEVSGVTNGVRSPAPRGGTDDTPPRRWVQHPLVKGIAVLVLLGFAWNSALFLLRIAF